ncbi:MAG: TonB-dependent receptor [Flavobacteriales bacterium]|nr:TonB-dependent receptor [Flavobacteriales bacterium]
MRIIVALILVCSTLLSWAQTHNLTGKVSLEGQEKKSQEIEIYLNETGQFEKSDKEGNFSFDDLKAGDYTLTIYALGYTTKTIQVNLNAEFQALSIHLNLITTNIKEVQIVEKKQNEYGIGRLKPVEGTAIYAGKKSEVVTIDDMAVNQATNNSRQIYAKVAGLNIWENDGAGIQLGIGGRGLSPNRVSNFNTRQNGYDISADALGYPESYYSPSAEAIERIEIVRGAASLQYGTQFGGFINFKLKEGPADTIPLEVVTRQTKGSFGFFNSFNSVGGNKGKFKYYAFYQYKTGDGWRPNSQFDVHSAHANLQYKLNDKVKIGVEYTYMHYIAQQPGGLTDRMFEQNPQQSIRDRNWFQVNWNLAALNIDYKISTKTDYNFRAFGLMAGRDAVGNLGQITRFDDPESSRDLLKDDYANFGFENRLLTRYSFLKNTSIFLIGMRYYNGSTDRKQGDGTAAKNADFSLINENEPRDSKYHFPSQNLAFFTENVFYLSPTITVTPGLRFEYISTKSDGYYFNRSTNLAGQVISEQKIQDNRANNRSFILGGIGFSYKPNEFFEAYSNVSQNYRSINFNDMRIVNSNYQVDTNLNDESGYSFDIGIRGNKNKWFNYDISFFMLSYQNRIGEVRITDPVLYRPIRFRTNVSDSRSYGLESFFEINLTSLLGAKNSKHQVAAFSNFSLMDARYINSKETAFENKKVELVPHIIFKGGISYRYKQFQLCYQYSYTAEHYTDATNATFTSNAVNGIIPAYAVMDLSAKYNYKHWIFETGINNLSNETYFTRRASGYPGPGIIPSDPRSYYLMVGLRF